MHERTTEAILAAPRNLKITIHYQNQHLDLAKVPCAVRYGVGRGSGMGIARGCKKYTPLRLAHPPTTGSRWVDSSLQLANVKTPPSKS